MSIGPSHDELMRMHELGALRDERAALRAENERLRVLYENAVGNREQFGWTINHLLECEEALRTVEAEAERLRDLCEAYGEGWRQREAEVERLQEALRRIGEMAGSKANGRDARAMGKLARETLNGDWSNRRIVELEAEVEHLRVRNTELKGAIEDYSLWRPGEKGHAAAHRKLMEAIR